MEWDGARSRFTAEKPKALASIQVQITPLMSAHESFHSPLPPTAHATLTTAVADTGAQTCASGPALLKSIGVERKDLIPTSHRIKGVTQSNLDIWGVLLATISVGEAKTNQVIYICENACGLYLSESALRDLHSISSSFPACDNISSVTSSKETCTCPKRSPPPKRPQQIPFTPNEANVEKLEKWILDYYSSSAFNVCEHQPLPEMTGKPITINFKPDVIPKVADYFTLQGFSYLVYADRYTGWVTVSKAPATGSTASSLIHELRTAFSLYGVPAELSTDGGPQFAAHSTQQFLQNWGVIWRVSSAYYPQSNGRAELAVKTAKRLLRENLSSSGDLNTDSAARALLQYRNTPLQDLNVSPAQLLYGRQLRDHMPSFAEALKIRPQWIQLAEDRERALAKRHLRSMESYNRNTRNLADLKVGDHVLVQNQTGVHPTRWDKTGQVMEVLPHDQYTVRMDGSGRCSKRNRRFLRTCLPFMSDQKYIDYPVVTKEPPPLPQVSTPEPEPMDALLEDIATPNDTQQVTGNDSEVPSTHPSANKPLTPTIQNPATNEKCQSPESLPDFQDPLPIRRSQRKTKPPARLSLKMHGKTHDESCRPCPS